MGRPIPVAPFHSMAHTAAQASIGPRDHASRTTSFAFVWAVLGLHRGLNRGQIHLAERVWNEWIMYVN
jgi:hypothetical protein